MVCFGQLTGQTISHYRVLDRLGAGGMRDVALKFLPPGARL